MKVFAIESDSDINRISGYLFYYEKSKAFLIELPNDADEWNTPLILSSFAKRGRYSVDSMSSIAWVRQRIVPYDRQNIACIMKQYSMKNYDEFELLEVSNGRCAQDDYFILPIEKEMLPKHITNRLNKRISEIIPIDNFRIIVFFRNGKTKMIEIKPLCSQNKFKAIINDEQLFRKVKIDVDGFGITWGKNLVISAEELYAAKGNTIPIKNEDLKCFIKTRVIDTDGAEELLDCSRQNISDLVKREKMKPVQSFKSVKLFLISEVQQRLWR